MDREILLQIWIYGLRLFPSTWESGNFQFQATVRESEIISPMLQTYFKFVQRSFENLRRLDYQLKLMP